MAVLSVKLFGNPVVRMDGREVTLPYRKADALLYYLVLKRKASRSELVGLLWADTDAATALKNLRHAVYTVRKGLENDFFAAGQRTMLEVNPELSIQCDVLDFLERGDLESYHGEFLEGFSIQRAEQYEEWIVEQRNLLQTQYLTRLLEAEREAFARGDLAQAERYGALYVSLDPLEESAAVTLMGVYSAQKKFRKAIGVYHELCMNLSEELSITPLKETTAFYYQIVNEWNSSTYRLEEQSDELLVGKEMALRKLLSLCNRSPVELRTPCALVEGEAGVGKTYLLDHVLNRYDFSDRLVCRSCCYQSETGTPLAPWNAVMMTLASEIETRRLTIPENYLKTAAGLFPCLAINFGAGYSESDMDYPLQTNYHVALESAMLILSFVAQKVPLLIVFEDIHWIDKSSCDMLATFLRRFRSLNVTVICTSRDIYPDYVRKFISHAGQDKIIERYVVKRFNREETKQFVHYYLGQEPPGDLEHLEEQLYQSTGGNALLLIQLMNSIQESKDLQDLPKDLEGIIGYRLANLPLDERQVLDLISVFTEWAGFDILSSILTKEAMELLYICGQLKQRMLVVESDRDGMLSYALAHEKIKSALIQQQSQSTRRILHLRVAQYLEERIKHTKGQSYNRLVYHYEAAGRRFEAFQYRVLALNAYTGLSYALLPTLTETLEPDQPGEESMPSYFRALERELEQLRSGGEDLEQLSQLELILLHAKSRYCIYVGQYEEGLEALRRLIRLCGEIGETDMLVRAHLQYVYYGIQTHVTQVMEEHLRVGMLLLKGREKSAEYGIYLRLSGLLLMMQGKYPQARAAFEQSIQTFQDLEPSMDGRYAINVAGVYNYLGESYRLEGSYDRAFHYYDQAIIHNRSRGYYPGAAVFYTNYGVAAFQKGDHQEARELFRYAVEIYRSSHEYSGFPIAMSYLARYDAQDSAYEQAAEKLRESHRVSDMIGSPWWKGITIYNSWRIRLAMEREGRHVPALEELWPASREEHRLWGLSYLRKLQPWEGQAEMELELAGRPC